MVYQPQYNLETGQADGMEVLIRWNHPDVGPVSPARFVPLAETRGLIQELTEHLVRCTLADLRSLTRAPRPALCPGTASC